MEAPTGPPRTSTPPGPIQPNIETIKRRLLRKGVFPTPKITHALRKKELQKRLRKSKRMAALTHADPPLSDSQKQALAEESHFRTLTREYRDFTKALQAKSGDGPLMEGKPWEGMERIISSECTGGGKIKAEPLRELGEFLEGRSEDLRWILDDDDIEVEQGRLEHGSEKVQDSVKRRRSEADRIRFLVDRISATNLSMKDWKFSKMMKQSGLQFTEGQLLKIVGKLGHNGQWRHALSIVEWVYTSKDHNRDKSRFVFTKLLAVLGKARRPDEALHVFNLMRGDCQIYPDMPAYHSIAVTLGRAGFLRELLKIIECMRLKPSKKIKNICSRSWDPTLEPDVVVFNTVLNACVPLQQWKGVFWVFEQMRKSDLKPNGATYGLSMEVMLQSGKYDLVHRFFEKMRRSGEALKAITYKVLVRAYWKEGKIMEAVRAVRDMEQRGVVGAPNVYYELACCLCYHGRWKQAMFEVENLIKLPHNKKLEITFTGMILSAMDAGHIDDCILIFEHMNNYCDPNIGTINAMLKVYGLRDMFSKAKELFEESRTKTGLDNCPDGGNLIPDVYTYSSMLEVCATAHQWEYFEYVYREMALSGFQLDQSKHGSLLVEASKAGKWHLLEHAFDSLLEAGEIPPLSFFSEMVCEAIAQQRCERAVTLVNSMAYAPFQVSEEQWTDLFLNNRDRVSICSLQKLLGAFRGFDLATEATVINLLRSLESLCGLSTEKPLPDDHIVGFDGNKREDTPNFILTGNVGHGPDTVEFDISSVETRSRECGDDDDVEGDALSDRCIDKWLTSIVSARLEEEVGGMEDDLDDWHGSNLLSANEILGAWGESKGSDDETCSLSQFHEKIT